MPPKRRRRSVANRRLFFIRDVTEEFSEMLDEFKEIEADMEQRWEKMPGFGSLFSCCFGIDRDNYVIHHHLVALQNTLKAINNIENKIQQCLLGVPDGMLERYSETVREEIISVLYQCKCRFDMGDCCAPPRHEQDERISFLLSLIPEIRRLAEKEKRIRRIEYAVEKAARDSGARAEAAAYKYSASTW